MWEKPRNRATIIANRRSSGKLIEKHFSWSHSASADGV
jgi:hypothetical protein